MGAPALISIFFLIYSLLSFCSCFFLLILIFWFYFPQKRKSFSIWNVGGSIWKRETSEKIRKNPPVSDFKAVACSIANAIKPASIQTPRYIHLLDSPCINIIFIQCVCIEKRYRYIYCRNMMDREKGKFKLVVVVVGVQHQGNYKFLVGSLELAVWSNLHRIFIELYHYTSTRYEYCVRNGRPFSLGKSAKSIYIFRNKKGKKPVLIHLSNIDSILPLNPYLEF